MDVRQLRIFESVYEHRHLSRAATLPNLSQSAVSFHLARLEADGGRRTTGGRRGAEDEGRACSGEVVGRIAVGLSRIVVGLAALPFMPAVRAQLSLSPGMIVAAKF